MSQSEIIEYAKSKGAEVRIRSFESAPNTETICVNFGKIDSEETSGFDVWKHGIFIDELEGEWVIGFSQSAKTQPLEQMKLMQVLELWFAKPSDEVFKPYE